MDNRLLIVIVLAAVIPLGYSLYFSLFESPRKAAVDGVVEVVEDSIVEEAVVDSIDVEKGDDRVLVTIRGVFDSSCPRLDRYEVNRYERVFDVVVTTRRNPNEICREGAYPFEEWVPLEMDGLDSGDYLVSVNGLETSFTW